MLVHLTAAVNGSPIYVNAPVESVRDTRGDPNVSPQGTLICTRSPPPHNEIVVTEALNVVVQLLNASELIVRQASRTVMAESPTP